MVKEQTSICTNFEVDIFKCNADIQEKPNLQSSVYHPVYASFGTFCVQISQLVEAQWAFKFCLEIDNSLLSTKIIIPNVSSLTAPQLMWATKYFFF